MGDLTGFDASAVEPNQGFEPIPAGNYDAVIVNSTLKDTKAGNGKILELELQILSGQFQNRKLFDRLNLVNNGPKKEIAEKIAKGTLSAICRAVGVMNPEDSSELRNKPLSIGVKCKRRTAGDPNSEIDNEITSYKARGASAPSTGAVPPGPTMQHAAPGSQPAPW